MTTAKEKKVSRGYRLAPDVIAKLKSLGEASGMSEAEMLEGCIRDLLTSWVIQEQERRLAGVQAVAEQKAKYKAEGKK